MCSTYRHKGYSIVQAGEIFLLPGDKYYKGTLKQMRQIVELRETPLHNCNCHVIRETCSYCTFTLLENDCLTTEQDYYDTVFKSDVQDAVETISSLRAAGASEKVIHDELWRTGLTWVRKEAEEAIRAGAVEPPSEEVRDTTSPEVYKYPPLDLSRVQEPDFLATGRQYLVAMFRHDDR